ncbi:MAG: 16S rRNA processing protein RimM [Ruminococcus sp.]|nr:16S rRNA processing protein RimM [Candidatus Copronaster equi]
MIKEFLEVGQIVGTHGVRGEMRINPWTDSPEFVRQFKTLYFDKNGTKPVKVISSRVHGNVALVKLDGIDTVEAASALRNKVLYIRRSDAKLKDGTYFIEELIGCEVYDADDSEKKYGRISDVSQTGANDVWHITDEKNNEYLIPAIKEVVIKTDVQADMVVIRPMKGIFDDEN